MFSTRTLCTAILFAAVLCGRQIGSVRCEDHADDGDECKPGMTVMETTPQHAQEPADVFHDRYPYLVSLQNYFNKATFCVGVLIRKDLVVTAASCFLNWDLTPTLRIGAANVQDPNEGEERTACRVMIHSSFQDDKVHLGHDIALIQLDKDSTLQPVKLDRDTSTPPAGHVIAMGWSLNENRFNPQHVQHVQMDVIPTEECSARLDEVTSPAKLSDKMEMDTVVCVEFEGNQCREGDAGAPLIKAGDGCGENDVFYGMLSFGPKCQSPDVYTRVSSYLDWIDNFGGKEANVFENPDCERAAPTK